MPSGKSFASSCGRSITTISASARDPAGTSRHESTISVYGRVQEGSSATKYRLYKIRCPLVRVRCKNSLTLFTARELAEGTGAPRKDGLAGICYRPFAIIILGASAQLSHRRQTAHCWGRRRRLHIPHTRTDPH